MLKKEVFLPERAYLGSGIKVFDADLHDAIIASPEKHLIQAAWILCDNRWSYSFTQQIEDEILDAMRKNNALNGLIGEIVSLLNGEDGDLRVGAAEILGVITPPGIIRESVVAELEKHKRDNSMRNYLYGGFQGDEEDMRTVSGCAHKSIGRLRAEQVAWKLDYPFRGDEASVIIEQQRQSGELAWLIGELVGLVGLEGHNTNEQVGAIEGLGLIQEAKRPEVIKTLVVALGNTKMRNCGDSYSDEEDIRCPALVAAEVLGRWVVKEAVDPLGSMAVNSRTRSDVRLAAVQALGQLGSESALKYLNSLCSSAEELGLYSRFAVGGEHKVPIKRLAEAAIGKKTIYDSTRAVFV